MQARTVVQVFKTKTAELISRGLAALVGGYLLAFGCTAFLSVYLPLARADRVVTASLMSRLARRLRLRRAQRCPRLAGADYRRRYPLPDRLPAQ